MVGKQGVSEDLYGTALQRLRERVKAGLPAPQGPGVERHTRREQVCILDAIESPRFRFCLGYALLEGRGVANACKGMSGAPPSRSTRSSEAEHGRAYGARALGSRSAIVLVGVTAHQGARESRVQGEVAQVAGWPGAVRDA